MDKVEKAVIDLGGKWPAWPKGADYLFTTGPEWGRCSEMKGSYQSAMSGGFQDEENHLSIKPTCWVHVCTCPEFMEARKRLENKPSWNDAPDWAKYLAQDADGEWNWYPNRPEPDGVEKGGQWTHDCFVDGLFLESEYVVDGMVFDDWRQSLERRPDDNEESAVSNIDWSKAPEGYDYWIVDNEGEIAPAFHRLAGDRYYSEDGTYWPADSSFIEEGIVSVYPRPQPDNKEGEGVEWEPGVDLPPVGVKCESCLMGAGLRVGRLTYKSDQLIVWRDEKSGHEYATPPESRKFRPIQSHRDKVIEALCEIANDPKVSSHNVDIRCSGAQRALIEAIADADIVKLPGDEQ